MKQILLVLFVFVIQQVQAQSPRLQLIEEFGSETVMQNAKLEAQFDTFMNQNIGSCISLRYKQSNQFSRGQLAWLGGIASNHRVAYYNIPIRKEPYGLQDGKAFLHNTNIDTGYLYNLTQTDINARSLVSSPFSINLTHFYDSSFDSVTIRAIINCTQNYVAYDSAVGAIKYRLMIAAKEVHVRNPTGSNGVKDYLNVVWDRQPHFWNDGITLKNNWQLGDNDTILFKLSISNFPFSYMFDYSQLCFVGLIQDDGYGGDKNKYSVLQAGYSQPIPVPDSIPDLGIESLTQFPNYCIDSVVPIYKITNHASPIIHSFQVLASPNYWSSWATYNWSGSLAKDSSVVISFPKTSLAYNYDTLVGRIYLVNGHIVGNSQWSYANRYDYNCTNNISNAQSAQHFHIQDTLQIDSLDIGFEDNTYYFEQFNYINPHQATFYRIRKNNFPTAKFPLGGYAQSEFSLIWNFGYMREKMNLPKEHTSLVSMKVDCSNKSNLKLRFDYSYCRSDLNSNDTLNVLASTDCGDHWQSLWLKSGQAMSTSNLLNDTTIFYPDSSQWQSVLIDMSAYNQTKDVMIKFEGIEGGGNALYVDNINLNSNLKLGNQNFNENNISSINLFPNPANDIIIILQNTNIHEITIIDMMGRTVIKQIYSAAENKIQLGISELSRGTYWVKTIDFNGFVQHGKLLKL